MSTRAGYRPEELSFSSRAPRETTICSALNGRAGIGRCVLYFVAAERRPNGFSLTTPQFGRDSSTVAAMRARVNQLDGTPMGVADSALVKEAPGVSRAAHRDLPFTSTAGVLFTGLC